MTNDDEEPCALAAAIFPESSPKWRKQIFGLAEYLVLNKTLGQLALLAAIAVDEAKKSHASARALWKTVEDLQETLPKATRSALAKHAAAAKLQNDPKQKAKLEAFKLWQAWQAGKTLHKSGAAFQRYVVGKLPVIQDTKTVERWCKMWRNENRD